MIEKWSYSDSVESREIVSLEDKYGHFIDGSFVSPKSKKYFDSISPSTEELLSQVSFGGEADVDNAVSSAREGFKTWQKVKPVERSKYLFKIARLIQERSREFAFTNIT